MIHSTAAARRLDSKKSPDHIRETQVCSRTIKFAEVPVYFQVASSFAEMATLSPIPQPNSTTTPVSLPPQAPSVPFDPAHNAERLLSHFSHLEDLLRLVRRTRNSLPSLIRVANQLPQSGSLEEWRELSEVNRRNVGELKEAVMNSQGGHHRDMDLEASVLSSDVY